MRKLIFDINMLSLIYFNKHCNLTEYLLQGDNKE